MFASDLSDAEQESLLSFMDSGKSYLEQHDHTEAMAKKLMDATLIFTQHLHKVETCSVSTQTEIVSTFDNECQTTAKWVALDKSVAPPVTTQQMPSNTDSLMSSTDSNVMRNSSSKLKKKLPYQSMPSLSPYADMTDVNRLEAEAKKINNAYAKSVKSVQEKKKRNSSSSQKGKRDQNVNIFQNQTQNKEHMRRRPESPRHQQDHIETGATTDLNEAEMHMKLKFAFQRAETQVNLFDEDSLEGSSLGAGMLGEDSNISYSNSSIAISRNGSTDSNCGSNAEHQDVFQDPYDSSYMKSNLYGEISNNYYNEHQQTHEYANGCGSSPDDKAGSLLPDIKSPGQQQLEHFRMEKSSKKSKKGKKLSPDLRSRCSSENSVGGNTYNSHNNSSRSLDPGSSSSSVKSNNGNSLFLRKEVEAPGKAIVEQARRLHGGNNASLHRPHSRAEKQLIQSPLAEPYFSRIRKNETPQYVYQHENLFENQNNSVNCKAISSKNSSTANSMDEFDSCSSYCTDSFSSPKMHKKVKEGTSKA